MEVFLIVRDFSSGKHGVLVLLITLIIIVGLLLGTADTGTRGSVEFRRHGVRAACQQGAVVDCERRLGMCTSGVKFT